MPTNTLMPTWFIPHGGGPCFFMDWNPPDAWHKMADFLRQLHTSLPRPPQAIIVVSAHWLEPYVCVTGSAQPSLIYDYYGFPPHTYELKYPAHGSPALAAEIATALNAAGIHAKVDDQRGFDHGMFIPMMLMFPRAHIPVVQLSLHQSLDPQVHLAMGHALQHLRTQDVLIIGSGMSFHNMRAYGNPLYRPISDAFDEWLSQTVTAEPSERMQSLIHWTQAPHARDCHPMQAEEHLIPLMTVVGAAGLEQGRKVFSDRVLETTLSGFAFG